MNTRRVSVLLLVLVALFLGLGCDQPPATQPPGTVAPLAPTVSPTAPPVITAPPVLDPVDGYLAVAPRVLRAGQTEHVAVTLLNRGRPATNAVRLTLSKDGRTVAETSAVVAGRGDLTLAVPRADEGDYLLRLTGGGFQAESTVRLEEGALVFVETDKPIYKPGQTVHIRVLALDPLLKPLPGEATVEVADAKGTKIFRKVVQTDDFGMATLDLPLSAEPNLGVWKVTARRGGRTAQVDVRVERYVLPKYEVKVDLGRQWVLASETITGTVAAEYSYGKPVKGEVEVRALRYVGTWQEFAKVTRSVAGRTDFRLPAVGYVSGVPSAGGQGNVRLEVTVREEATGYEEKTTQLLTVAASPVTLRLIPESVTFKPSLPLSVLVVAETPDKKPVDADVQIEIAYTKADFSGARETRQVAARQGKALLSITPPADAVGLTLGASGRGGFTSLALQSGYSPSGSFVHVEQTTTGPLKVGDTAKFRVTATKQATSFYYEVVARGMVVFSDVARTPDIALELTPGMTPNARLLVYQILPTSEVAADYVPFAVEGSYPGRLQVGFDRPEAKPGEAVGVDVRADGPARVGLVAVDRSVFILAENRLNLQQVFAELERLYQQPQVELHEARPLDKLITRGAKEVFGDAGVVVMSNQQVPAGKEYASPVRRLGGPLAPGIAAPAAADAVRAAAAPAPAATTAPAAENAKAEPLAEVQRIRQFFPETWIWTDLTTDETGRAAARFTAPDSITTWALRAVALSKRSGLGVAEAGLRVIQPFFVQIDLPYSVIRGEQFPVKVALYNYQTTAEEFTVELEPGDWFELRDQPAKRVQVGPNDVGGVTFTIRPNGLGTRKLKITARSRSTADAIVKDLIVEPEGVARELVDNAVLSAGASRRFDLAVPADRVDGSARAYLTLTGNYLTQSIAGLEGLLKMPFGCGEQNMILLAPNVFVARYLKETGQLKPEVMAKAESLTMTGYQRELTYRRKDGSFSAFGEQDREGSLWLTAFVLKTFAQAKDLIYVDDAVLASARTWLVNQQKPDGGFDQVGFVAHQEMLGGLKGRTALTAYLAIALRESGETAGSARAVRYLEGALDGTNDPYALAIAAYALELAKSPRAGAAYDRLLAAAHESDEGLYWGDWGVQPLPLPGPGVRAPIPQRSPSAAIETTGYALLALVEHGDRANAARAGRWLVSRRNAYGGFGSTQDTVVGLQALARYAAGAKSDVDATVTLRAAGWQKEVRISPENADVLQTIEVPAGAELTAEVRGKGQVVVQSVRRFNLPQAEAKARSAFQIDVGYGAGTVQVDDLITVSVTVQFTPPEPIEAGMVVLDIAVPTGFAPVPETLAALPKLHPKVKRYDVAGRKVILYLEDMAPNERIALGFKARALYPVRAQPVASQAYSYYQPELKGETLGGGMEVIGK